VESGVESGEVPTCVDLVFDSRVGNRWSETARPAYKRGCKGSAARVRDEGEYVRGIYLHGQAPGQGCVSSVSGQAGWVPTCGELVGNAHLGTNGRRWFILRA